MDALRIEGTDETPEINFDPSANVFKMSGRSLPEDVKLFFGPVFEWLDGYFGSPNDTSVFEFELEYFNTASSKMILDVLMKIEGAKNDGKDVKIVWFFDEDDEDMEEAGEEYAELIEVPFELKELD